MFLFRNLKEAKIRNVFATVIVFLEKNFKNQNLTAKKYCVDFRIKTTIFRDQNSACLSLVYLFWVGVYNLMNSVCTSNSLSQVQIICNNFSLVV